ncbi:MAG: PaaI family thioesterase [Paracoccaceae bacterium]|jgi:uncharacterized protein (TIGR00369 family)|nr:PaaI family thioesterase [Paracoccaceae bacterium]
MHSQKTVNPVKFLEALPHGKALGLELVDIGNGKASISLPYDVRFVGDPETGVIHGGAISAAIDTCCGSAVMCHPDVQGMTATIDLRIDYLRSAKPGDKITTTAECYHMTRSVAFVRAVAVDSDSKTPVATATGTFMVGKSK